MGLIVKVTHRHEAEVGQEKHSKRLIPSDVFKCVMIRLWRTHLILGSLQIPFQRARLGPCHAES